MEGSPAWRAGLKPGDVLASVGGTPVRTTRDLERARGTLLNAQVVEITFYRRGRLVRRPVPLIKVKNLFESGDLTTLGLKNPRSIVAGLLKEQDRIGSLLRTELTARCSYCTEREQRVRLARQPNMIETLLHVIPVAGGLLGMDAAIKWQFARSESLVRSFTENANSLSELVHEAGALRKFLTEKMQIGKPLVFRPGGVEVLSGDRFSAPARSGGKATYRLAYVSAPGPEAETFFRKLIAACKAKGALLVAIPDGIDHRGHTHCHLLVVQAKQMTRATAMSFSDLTALVLEGYVNLVLVRNGLGTAQDYRLNNGGATRFVLRALRKVESMR